VWTLGGEGEQHQAGDKVAGGVAEKIGQKKNRKGHEAPRAGVNAACTKNTENLTAESKENESQGAGKGD